MEMKRYFAFGMAVLTACCLLSTACSGISKGENACSINNGALEETVEKFDAYDLDLYMKPLWEGEIVYNETLTFVGETDVAPLLYPAAEIISVRSYDLQTEYVNGKDYGFHKKNNVIILGEGTKMPYWTEEEYYPSEKIQGKAFDCTVAEKPYIVFGEGSTMCERQVAVTYRHTAETYITKPLSQKEVFSQTIGKLQANEETKILFFGDSITVGANSSGYVSYSPYAPTWPRMVFDSMVKKYGVTKAEYINTAVGGWSTQNGLDDLQARVLDYQPDAVFIGFGMNDVNLSPAEHIAKIKQMVDLIRAALPNVEICLISTMLPNAEAQGFYREQVNFQEKYAELASAYRAEGKQVCYANVTKMHQELLKVKRYRDMTGNNVNHPNDFLARVYAQTVFQTVCGD